MKRDTSCLPAAVGARLRDRRKMLGVLQGDLADLSGIAVHTLSNIESGKGNPSLLVLEKLMDCLGLELTIGPRWPTSGVSFDKVREDAP